MTDLISVVVPAYNEDAAIVTCLDRLVHAITSPFEILVQLRGERGVDLLVLLSRLFLFTLARRAVGRAWRRFCFRNASLTL